MHLSFSVSNIRHTGPDFQKIQEPQLYFMCTDAVTRYLNLRSTKGY